MSRNCNGEYSRYAMARHVALRFDPDQGQSNQEPGVGGFIKGLLGGKK